METLKYKVITSNRQYDKYCKILEGLVFTTPKTKVIKEEIALLTLLIENYDKENMVLDMIDPVTLLKSLMSDHNMKAVDLSQLLNVSKGLVSDILNYKKGLSKEVIRTLADYFKLNQEAFNREYTLKQSGNTYLKNAGIMNSKKNFKQNSAVYAR